MKAPAYEAMKKGEVTAYLSLVFILLMTFVGGIMESASIQMAKNYRRADMNRAMESVFAEYQKELLEEYEIFALIQGMKRVNTERIWSFGGWSIMERRIWNIRSEESNT